MPTERVQRRIDRLLDQAEEAADEREWKSVLESVAGVLALDPENEDALSFRDMAQQAGAADSESFGSVTESTVANETVSAADMPTSFADGRYVVSKFLGEEGKKKVYLAHDTVLDRDIAFALIKMEGLDDIGRTRITREA